MLIKKQTNIGPVGIIVRNKTKERLKKTCFRDRKALAGNFCEWTSVEDVFKQSLILNGLIAAAEETLKEGVGTNSVCIRLNQFVGWSGTDKISEYRSEQTETFFPNRKSMARKVKASCVELFAPQTDYVTLVYEVREEVDMTAVVVHSVYPGPDIGELAGNVTERENVVFFDWNHPGRMFE